MSVDLMAEKGPFFFFFKKKNICVLKVGMGNSQLLSNKRSEGSLLIRRAGFYLNGLPLQ